MPKPYQSTSLKKTLHIYVGLIPYWDSFSKNKPFLITYRIKNIFLAFNQYVKHPDQPQISQYKEKSWGKKDYIPKTSTQVIITLFGFNIHKENISNALIMFLL